MLQEQVVPVNFGQGVDTKTDPKAVVAGKFLRLENGLFTKPNQIAKRNGYTNLPTTIAGIGSLIAPRMTHEYNDELLAADQNLLLSLSPSDSAWISRGSYVSTELTRFTIDQDIPVSGFTDSAVLGNYVLYGWSTVARLGSAFPNPYPSKVYGSIVDTQTGSIVIGPSLLSTPTVNQLSAVRCVTLGGTVLAIIYVKDDGTSLVSRIVTFGGGGVVSFGAEQVITVNYTGSTFSGGGFDVVQTATGASIVYLSTGGISVANLNTAGLAGVAATIVDATASAPVHISLNAFNTNLWVYWNDTTYVLGQPTACTTVYAVYSSVLAVVLAKTPIVAQVAPFWVSNMIATSVDATHQTLYFGINATVIGVGFLSQPLYTDETRSVVVSAAGVVAADALFAYGIMPYSRPFSLISSSVANNYAVFLYRGAKLALATFISPQEQPTFFAIQLTNVPSVGEPLVVARFGGASANSQAVLWGNVGYTPNTYALSATKFIFACGIETQEFRSDFFEQQQFSPGGLAGAFSYSIDFNSNNAYRPVNSGELAVLNGGVIQVYDSNKCTEFGFHLFPEILAYQEAIVGGAVADGTYSIIAIFQWTDAQGNLHQSAPSEAQTVVVSGAPNAITTIVTCGYISQKNGLSVAIYRTVGAGGATGSIYYLVTDPVFVLSADSSGAFTATYTDILADADILGNPQAYTYPASSVLENDAPPPSMIMVTHNNRLWFVDSENPNSIWYTKSFSPGTGLSPSGFMLEQIDPKFGNISGLAEMDDKIIIGKESGFIIQSGDGVNDVGSGSTLSFPQSIPSDVGISELKSIVLTPNGVMFKSLNGIYILTRSLQISYIGAEVEQYNSQTITSATITPGKSQIRFLCSTGLTLVYDYIFNQWSTFTNHTGLSSTPWNGGYVYATTGGKVYKESPGVYLDDATAFALLAQTSWLALASIQGFQRVRRLIMLGDFINGASAAHNLSIAAAYDFSTTFQAAITYAFGAISASGVFQYRERLPIQKCDSISLLIQETTTGNNAEYIDLTNISFEAGVKKGVNKLRGQQSVG